MITVSLMLRVEKEKNRRWKTTTVNLMLRAEKEKNG